MRRGSNWLHHLNRYGEMTSQQSVVSASWGNTAYCVKLSGEDLSRCSNEIESVVLRKYPHHHYRKWCHNNVHFSEFAPHHGGKTVGTRRNYVGLALTLCITSSNRPCSVTFLIAAVLVVQFSHNFRTFSMDCSSYQISPEQIQIRFGFSSLLIFCFWFLCGRLSWTPFSAQTKHCVSYIVWSCIGPNIRLQF